MKQLLLLILLAANFAGLSQTTDSLAIQTYLQQNMEVLNLEKQAEIHLFDEDFYKNKLFLFGENHGSSNPQKADIILFKQLYQAAGVRFYIAEVDDSKAWMLNNYLKDGNESWLKKVFSSWVADTAQWANQSNYNKFKALHNFYTSLPANGKFTIIGIDVVQDYSLLKEHSHFLLDKKKNTAIKLYADSLLTITDTITYVGRKDLGSFARRFLKETNKNSASYEKILGAGAQPFIHYLTSLSFIGSGMYRDSLMYRNMLGQVGRYQLQDKKCYGFLGFYHCLLTGYNKSMPFAAELQQHRSIFSGKLVSIQMLALNAKTLMPYVAQMRQLMPAAYADKLRKENPDFVQSSKYVPYDLSNDNSMMKINGMEYLKAATAPNTTTLFKLNGRNSPFVSGKLLAEVSGFQTVKLSNSSSTTLDAFQYVLLFRDSKAGVPVE